MKLLYKSESNKRLDGVCGGIAEYYKVDPTLIRAGYAFVDVITGVLPGLIAYAALMWIMPTQTEVGNG
jgi:phage shock protein C